jgi:hypothetical protein
VVLRKGRIEHVVPQQLLVRLRLHRAHPVQPLDQQVTGLLELRDELEGVEVESASQPLQKVIVVRKQSMENGVLFILGNEQCRSAEELAVLI